MADEIFLCISQQENNIPYRFKLTGISVYSVEEAAYHCFHYWKQSIDEFCSPDFLSWVKDAVGLPFLASKIMATERIKSPKDRLIAFFSLIDYFDEIQITALKTQLTEWEKRLEWERLKDQADYLYKKGELNRAIFYYRKAMEKEVNIKLLNNLGITCIAAGLFEEGVSNLEKAYEIEPNNLKILLHLAEGYIYCHNFEKAIRMLNAAEEIDAENPDILFLHGVLNYQAANIRYSIDYFERAIAIKPDSYYIYRLTEVYTALRQFDKGIECINRVREKDKEYFLTLATLHVSAGNIPAAIKDIERALLSFKGDVQLWTRLAYYYRLDYDLQKAYSAIVKALSIEADNEHALLEHARIKKAMGKTKEYQGVLNRLLTGFKEKIRETAGL